MIDDINLEKDCDLSVIEEFVFIQLFNANQYLLEDNSIITNYKTILNLFNATSVINFSLKNQLFKSLYSSRSSKIQFFLFL